MRICQIKELILKPCPFCGGNAIICASQDESIKDNKYISNITCNGCGATVQGDITRSMLEADIKAAKLWNQRTAVDVVHCKECKWYDWVDCNNPIVTAFPHGARDEDNYCNFGEQKEG